MSTSFVTPGRRAGGTATSGSQRRIVRSALEVLMDTASPEIGLSARKATEASPTLPAAEASVNASPSPRPSSKASGAGNAGFTVTYTAAAPLRRSAAGAVEQSRGAPQMDADDRTAAAQRGTAVREEPSALAFLSPNSKRGSRSHGSGRLPFAPDGVVATTKGKPTARSTSREHPRASTEAPKSRPAVAMASSPPDTSRNLYEEVEQASEEEPTRLPVSSRTPRVGVAATGKSVSFSSVNSSMTVPEDDASEAGPLYTESELMAHVTEALTAYEQQRDEEETRVLEEVAAEIDRHRSRYDTLQHAHDALITTQHELQTRLQRSETYAHTLEQKLSAVHDGAQAQRERADRLEVALRHTQDAQRLPTATTGHRSPLSSHASPSVPRTTREASLEDELKARDARLAEVEAQLGQLKTAAEQHAQEKQQFEHDCDAIKSRVIFFSERMGEMEAVLREKNAQLQRTQRQLADAKAEQQQLRRQTAEAAATTASVASPQRLAELETNLQQQTDEVRRRMHRITVLEREKAALAAEAQQLRHVVCAAATYQTRLEAELDTIARTLRLYARKPQLWLQRPPSSETLTSVARRAPGRRTASVSPPPPEDDLDETRSFTDAALNASFATSSSGDSRRHGPSDRYGSDDDDDTGDTAVGTGSLGSLSPRARSSPAAQAHRKETRPSSHRARTVSPRRGHAHSSSTRGDITKAQAKDAIREVSASQSVCLRTAQDAARQLSLLHKKTQSYVARLKRMHETHLAEASSSAATAPTTGPPSSPTSSPSSSSTTKTTPLVQKLEEACRTLQAALTAKSAELEEVQTECHLRGEDLRLLERHVHELQSALATHEAQQGASTSATAQLTADLETLRAHAACTKADLDARTRECAQLTETLLRVRDELAEAERSTQQRTNEWQEKHSLSVSKVKRLEDENAKLEATAAENESRIKELHRQLQDLRSHQATARQRGGREQRELAQDVAQLRQQLATITALHEANKGQLEKERAEAAAKESERQHQQEKLHEKIAAMRRRLLQLTNNYTLHFSAEQGTLTTLLDMLKAFDGRVTSAGADAAGAGCGVGAGTSPKDVVGTRLFQHIDGSDLTGEDANVNTTTTTTSGVEDGSASASLAYLTRCRSEVVCLVQRVLLEVARLRQSQEQQPLRRPGQQVTEAKAPSRAETHSPQRLRRETDPIDEKELVLHNCSYQEDEGDARNELDADGSESEQKFVDDDLLDVLHACCVSNTSPRRDESRAFSPATPSSVASAKNNKSNAQVRSAHGGDSPFFLGERTLNAPPPLPKAKTTGANGAAAGKPAREPHAHLLVPRSSENTGTGGTSAAAATVSPLQSRVLHPSSSVFAS